MAGVSIRIDIDTKALKGGLKALHDAGANPQPTWDVLGRRWVDLMREGFATGQGPDGEPWKPSKRAQAEGGLTLVDKAELRDSLTHEADDDGVTVGTDKVKAPALQFGATIVPTTAKFLRFVVPGGRVVFAKKVTLPPRPFVGINPTWIQEFEELVAARLKRISSAGGAGDGTPA